MLIQSTVYLYSSSLEIASPRFTQPEDFFTYLVFVASVILVSDSLYLELFQKSRICFLSCFLLFFYTTPRIICPPSLNIAEAVPGSEEDYPCIPCSTAFAKSKWYCMRCGIGGMTSEIAVVIL